MFTHKFVDTIFERSVTLVVGTAKEYERFLRSQGIKSKVTKGACGETSSYDLPSQFYKNIKTKRFFIWLVQFNGTERDIGTLTHECRHTTQEIMEDLGVTYRDGDANEAHTYYLDSMVRQFLSALWGKEDV